jgi:hypothetical protein
MRIDRRLLQWGVFLLVLGVIPLAIQQGWIPDDLPWWQLWPVLLIGLGISILLRRTTAAALGGLISAVTLAAMIGGTLASGFAGGFPSLGVSCAGGSTGDPFATQTGTFSGGSVAQVRLEMGCGDLNVESAPGSGWTVAGSSDDGRVPDIDAAADRLAVTTPESGTSFFRDRSSWQITLPTDSTVDIDATVNAGSARLELGSAQVEGLRLGINAGSGFIDLGATAQARRLTVDVNAGSASIILPERSISGTLSANAGSIEFCVDLATVGIRIVTGDNITAGNNFDDAGLDEVADDVWESPGYGGATERIDLAASANAGSLNLNPEDGCQ